MFDDLNRFGLWVYSWCFFEHLLGLVIYKSVFVYILFHFFDGFHLDLGHFNTASLADLLFDNFEVRDVFHLHDWHAPLDECSNSLDIFSFFAPWTVGGLFFASAWCHYNIYYKRSFGAYINKLKFRSIFVWSGWNSFERRPIGPESKLSTSILNCHSCLVVGYDILLTQDHLSNQTHFCLKSKLKDEYFFGIHFEVSDASVRFIIRQDFYEIPDIPLQDLVRGWQ